jgi:hypothetical protein
MLNRINVMQALPTAIGALGAMNARALRRVQLTDLPALRIRGALSPYGLPDVLDNTSVVDERSDPKTGNFGATTLKE